MPPRWVAALVACALLPACTVRSEEREILPWLKERFTYRAFGSFGGSTEQEYLVRRFGFFWFKLDPMPTSVSVVGPDLALASDGARVAMLHRSRWKPVVLCEKYADFTQPPRAAAVDCLYRIRWDGTMPGHLMEVRLQRVDADGATVIDRTIAVDGTGRIFPSGLFIRYYDDLGRPWLLIQGPAAGDFRHMPRDCALVTWGDAGPVLLAGSPEMTYRDCESKPAWEALGGRPLRDAHPRAEAARKPP